MKLGGVITAVVTPFKLGSIDYESLRRLIRLQLDAGVQGFVVAGTTGESPVLNSAEKLEILKFVLNEVENQVPVLFGSGSNSTAETIELSQKAQKLSPSGLLVVTPYYNKPPQRGLYEHFKAVATSVDIPIILYSVPGRTGVNLEVETVVQLSKIKNIAGLKDATGDLASAKTIRERVPDSFSLLSGDDGTCLDFCFLGGDGVISVLSHVVPEGLVSLVTRAKRADPTTRKQLTDGFSAYKKLVNLLFCEANPIPVKWALKEMGALDSAELRLPLVELSEDFRRPLRQELQSLGVLN